MFINSCGLGRGWHLLDLRELCLAILVFLTVYRTHLWGTGMVHICIYFCSYLHLLLFIFASLFLISDMDLFFHFRWRGDLSFRNVGTHNPRVYRDQLTSMTDDQFTWQPYTDLIIPDYCRQGESVWRTRAPMICFDRVEWHLPDRVLRQFGMLAVIPPPCDTGVDFHSIDRRGRPNVNWRDKHQAQVLLWESRHHTLVDGPVGEEVVDYTHPYMIWYHNITVLLIQHPRDLEDSGYRSHATSFEGLVSYRFSYSIFWSI